MKNYVITIERGFGSGGKTIGCEVAKRLGIPCYSDEIIQMASEESGLNPELFERLQQKNRNGSVSKNLAAIEKAIIVSPGLSATEAIKDENLYNYQAKIIRTLQETESCVIVGKAADYVLRDCPNVLSVYIEAPRDYTRRRIMEKQCVPPDIADNMITRTDRYRADYYEQYTHGNYWTNPVNYDITLNSARLGIEGCVNMIEQCLKEKLGIKLPEKAG